MSAADLARAIAQKKVSPLFIFENGRIDPAIVKAVKTGAGGGTAEGSCYKNQDGVLIFQLTKGDLDGFDMVDKFQIGDAPALESNLEPSAKEATKPEAAVAETPKPEEQEGDQDFKVRLTDRLKKVRLADGKESLPFVTCIAKPFYGLLLAKSATDTIRPAHKKTLTDLTQGTKFIVGNCLFENNAYTFVVEAVPGGLAKNLQKSLKQFTVIVRSQQRKAPVRG